MKIVRSELMDLYTDYLLSGCGVATATGMSAALDNRLSHDVITDLLSSDYISSRRLWASVKPMCREVEQEGAVLIIDDSMEARPYTDCNELISWRYDHTGGGLPKGLYHGNEREQKGGSEQGR